MNNYRYENESGRSMIEMLGVLAIIGVLSVGGIAGYSKAMNKFKTNQVADNVSMLVANIKTLYAQQKSYADLDNTSAVSMGVVPDEIVAGEDTNKKKVLRNAFNGEVHIGSAQGTKANDSFFIAFNGLSKEACITLATNDWGSSYSSGLVGLKVGDTGTISADDTNLSIGCTKDGSDGSICPGKMPMPVIQAATHCNCSGNTCYVFWKYY